MAKKKTNWHVFGRRVMLRAARKNKSKIILAKSVSESAKEMYDYFVEEVGSDVPDELELGSRVYIALPGLVSIEGTTNTEDEETFFFIDFNFIHLYEKPNKK